MQFLRTLIASIIGTLVALGIIVLIGTALVIGIASTSDRTPTVTDNSVLSVELSGTLPERSTDTPFQRLFMDQPTVDLRAFKQTVRNAAADERIEVLWLRPNGITDQWAVLQEMRAALMEFKESGKQIVAYSQAGGFNEKDYYLASTADRVYAPPESSFELDGFAITVAYYNQLLEDLNVEPQIVRAGQYKSAVEPFTQDSMSPENEEQLTEILRTQNETFLTTLADARGMPLDSLEYLAEEFGIYMAESAYETGLLDGLLYESEVRDRLKESTDRSAEEDLNSVSLNRYSQIPPSAVGRDVTGENEIAVVYATGSITTGESRDTPPTPLGDEILGSETFVDAVETAIDDENVRAIVVRINSPGGAVTASDVMWHAMRRAADEKPLIVSMGNVAASGGYYMAVPADTIVADPLSITGSIGVFGLFFDVSGFFEDHGVNFDGVRTSPYADAFSGLRGFTEEEMNKYRTVIDEMYEDFLTKVADDRPLTIEEVRNIAEGRVWTGIQAEEIGLVDVLGTLEDAVDIAAERADLEEGDYRIRTLPQLEPFPFRLARSFQARLTHWLPDALLPADHPWNDHMRTLNRLDRYHGSPQMRLPYRINIR